MLHLAVQVTDSHEEVDMDIGISLYHSHQRVGCVPLSHSVFWLIVGVAILLTLLCLIHVAASVTMWNVTDLFSCAIL